MKFAIILFDGAEELDFAGPWEVFTAAGHVIATEQLDLPRPEVFTVSERGGTVRAAKGLRVIADHAFAEAPRADVLLVPGGVGVRREVNNGAMLSYIADLASTAQWSTSVCTGSLLLTAAGPARGRAVTTYHGFVSVLRERGENSVVHDDMRFVRDGQVVTSAGVSAGIDMALWLVGQIWSPELARKTQRYIEYDPAPPYQARV